MSERAHARGAAVHIDFIELKGKLSAGKEEGSAFFG